MNSIIDESVAQEQSDIEEKADRRSKFHRIFGKWPWKRQLNPHYVEVEQETATWIAGFDALSPEMRSDIVRGKITLCGCLAYPNVSKARARAAVDHIHIIFFIDEEFEKFTPSEARLQKAVILDAFHKFQTPRPKDEWMGGEMARQFYANHMANGTEVSRKRYIQGMDEYLEGLVQEAVEKQDGHILDIKSYIYERRRTIAGKTSFPIIELSFNIPDEAMAHTAIQEMMIAAVDMISCCNDLASYRVEKMRGIEHHNIITCIMNEHGTGENDAMVWVEGYLFGISERFLTAMASLPEWEEPLNSEVKEYCNGLGQWVRGTCDWTFGSERYFPQDTEEVVISLAGEA